MTDRDDPTLDPDAEDRSLLLTACRCWQGGRDEGSSLLRGAARVLTGIPHYFSADFITDYEHRARADASIMDMGRTLLDAVANSGVRDVGDYTSALTYPLEAGPARGIKPQPERDDLIDERVRQPGATLPMPLWGFSLDPEKAREYGTRFIFHLTGPFSGIPLAALTGDKRDEYEVVGGGSYAVADVQDTDDTTNVYLRQTYLSVPVT